MTGKREIYKNEEYELKEINFLNKELLESSNDTLVSLKNHNIVFTVINNKKLLSYTNVNPIYKQTYISIDEDHSKVRGLRHKFMKLFVSITFTVISLIPAYFANTDNTLFLNDFNENLVVGGCTIASLLGIFTTVINGKNLVKLNKKGRGYRLKPRK